MPLDFIANVLFPRICVACGRRVPQSVVCDACFRSIEIRHNLLCGSCFARTPTITSSCHPDTPYVLGAAGHYDDEPLQALIHHLKFGGVRNAAIPLTALMVHYSSRMNIELIGFTVVPIPLSPRRERVRGYNQAELIAAHFAQAKGLTIDTGSLFRTKHTPPQSETKNAAERRENIRGAFAIRAPAAVRNRPILLIDDVATSGATLLEASRTLKTAGAGPIIALTAAKT